MIKTTYTCDRCHEPQKPDGLFTIDFTAKQINSSFGHTYRPACGTAHWCRECLDATGFFVRQQPTTDVNVPAPTITDLIQEMINTAIEEHTS